jgi:transcriptional regulator with XRE-family HTH domain
MGVGSKHIGKGILDMIKIDLARLMHEMEREGITQADLPRRMQCSESNISKLFKRITEGKPIQVRTFNRLLMGLGLRHEAHIRRINLLAGQEAPEEDWRKRHAKEVRKAVGGDLGDLYR